MTPPKAVFETLRTLSRHLSGSPPAELTFPEIRGVAEAAPPDRPLRILSWNLQYAAGRDQTFFYDGGTAVSVDRATVMRTLDGIADVLRSADADIVLLQEVDRNSRRTAFVDEHAELRRRLNFPCDVSATYHRSPYIPFPTHEHLGRVDMHLSIFSRFGLGFSRRHPLPSLREPPIRRLFNLRRAILEAHVLRDGSASFVSFNTHFSAFSRGDGTVLRQVSVSKMLLDACSAEGHPWVFAGDLNALPPGDHAARLPDPDEYPENPTPIAPLFESYAQPNPVLLDPTLRTYLPPGAIAPDRVLDYVFNSSNVQLSGFRTIREAGALSDHLPFVVDVNFLH